MPPTGGRKIPRPPQFITSSETSGNGKEIPDLTATQPVAAKTTQRRTKSRSTAVVKPQTLANRPPSPRPSSPPLGDASENSQDSADDPSKLRPVLKAFRTRSDDNLVAKLNNILPVAGVSMTQSTIYSTTSSTASQPRRFRVRSPPPFDLTKGQTKRTFLRAGKVMDSILKFEDSASIGSSRIRSGIPQSTSRLRSSSIASRISSGSDSLTANNFNPLMKARSVSTISSLRATK